MSGHRRREHGSEFHWPPPPAGSGPASAPWDPAGSYWGSGRDALHALVAHGAETRGWRRLWVPSFFCQDVAAPLARNGVEILAYPDAPGDAAPAWEGADARAGDAVLHLNPFGLRPLAPATTYPAGVEVIEDHTHDPWSGWAWSSTADWCMASLRKTLPVPDGGVLWSPRGHAQPHPPAVQREHRTASLDKLAAMVLKGVYLDGGPVSKDAFRALFLAGEAAIGTGPVSAMPSWTRELLGTFPTMLWREQRRSNHGAFSRALGTPPGVILVKPEPGGDATPFVALLVFDDPERRDHVRRSLVAECVFPAVHWPMDDAAIPGIPPEHVELSRRVLSIHCDFRYDADEMARVGERVAAFAASWEEAPR